MMAPKHLVLLSVLSLGVAAVACSSGEGVGLLGSPLPGMGGSPYGSGIGGAANGSGQYLETGGVTVDAAAIAPDNLDGFWTITVTDLTGSTQSMGINVNVGAFVVDHWTGIMQALANINASAFDIYHEAGSVENYLAATHMSTVDMDLGVIPFELSGRWHLGNDPETGANCESTLSPTVLEAHCNEVFPPSWIGPMTDGWLDGTKTVQLPSVFGQLGGEWQLAFFAGGSCVVHIEHTTMGITCTGTGLLDGTSVLTFNGDTASGCTSRGVEFSAVR